MSNPKKIIGTIPTDMTGVVHLEDEDGTTWKPASPFSQELTAPPTLAEVFQGYLFILRPGDRITSYR